MDRIGGGMGGTETTRAVREHYDGHDRVLIVTDEQAYHDGDGPSKAIPSNVPLYTWNVHGYSRGMMPSGTAHRHVMAGLTDHSFRQVPLLEAGRDGHWPWMI